VYLRPPAEILGYALSPWTLARNVYLLVRGICFISVLHPRWRLGLRPRAASWKRGEGDRYYGRKAVS
jgi:hypothetical protein